MAQLDRHEAEHGARPGAGVAPAGCCCCCCCLHTLGGIIGAINGSTQRLDSRPFHFTDEKEEPFGTRRDAFDDEPPVMPVPVLYWLLVLFLGAVTAVVTYLGSPTGDPSMFGAGVFIAFMFLPALQLGASFLTMLAILVFYPQRRFPLRRVGRITLWSYVGTIIGLLIMTGCTAAMMSGMR